MLLTHPLLQQTLHSSRLLAPYSTQFGTCPQSLEPDNHPQHERKRATHQDHPALKFEPEAIIGHEQAWNGDNEGDKNKYSIDDRRCKSPSVSLRVLTN